MERHLLKKDCGKLHLAVPYRGASLLRHPLFNKGTAFTRAERAAFGLEGLLPDAVSTMEQQARRVYANIARKDDPLERYIGLAALQDRNEHLFYRVLIDHLEEFLPIVYTPVAGQACRQFSQIFRRARGLWITPAHQGRIAEVLGNVPCPDVRLVVVTDNERILGLGDQGVGGMALPVGKLALYTAAGGVHPAQALPISLDVGTNNPELLNDELYLGWRWPRLKGADYDGFVEEFVLALKRRFPGAIVQWEDFERGHALRLLERFRRILPSFNDDIQGTAAAALAAVRSSGRITGRSLVDERVVILGAGAVGTGIAQLLRKALVQAGQRGDAVTSRVAVIDTHGFLVDGGDDIVGARKREFAWPAHLAAARGLRPGASVEDVIRQLQPTVLLGATGRPGEFKETAVRSMAAHTERPVLLGLSMPSEASETDPADLVAWSDGRALVAPRSAFPLSVFVFPAIGLGAIVSRASEITDGMFLAAANALAGEATAEERSRNLLLPAVWRLREVTARVAEAVVRAAREEGVGLPIDDVAIGRAVAHAMWDASYPTYDPVPVDPRPMGVAGGPEAVALP